jgi:hypothetical protein
MHVHVGSLAHCDGTITQFEVVEPGCDVMRQYSVALLQVVVPQANPPSGSDRWLVAIVVVVTETAVVLDVLAVEEVVDGLAVVLE